MDEQAAIPGSGDIQINEASQGGYLLSVQRGAINVYQQPAPFNLVPFRRNPAPLSDNAMAQPSHLLATANRVVDFYGRHSELESLRKWRDNAQPFAVQLHHAPGGAGKTRLVARFAELSIDEGWAVAEAHQTLPGYPQGPSVAMDRLATGPAGVIVIVDYADRWPLAVLQALLLNPGLHRGRVRVVLLSRALGSWWTALRSKLDRAMGAVAEAVYLRPLADTAVERAEIFRLARDRFGSLLGVDAVNDIDPPESSQGVGQELVLTVHMAALAAVYARKAGQDVPADPAAVSAYLLRREVAHWFEMFDRGVLATRPDVLARAVYAAVLTRALPPPSAVKVLSLLQIASGDNAVRVIDDHASCYPPIARTTVLEPMYPDQLAEDFYALQTPGHAVGWYEPDVWVAEFTARLVQAADDDADLAVAVPRMMLTLIEVARRWEHIARGQLFPLLRERPDLLVRAGGPALAALGGLSNLDLSVLEALVSRLPLRPRGRPPRRSPT